MNCMVCRGPREQQIYCAECSRMVRLWKREEIPSAVRQLKELRKDNVALRRRIEDLSKKRYHLQQRLIQRQQLQYRLQKSREVLHRAQQGCRQERERLAEWRESNERRAAGLKAARKELKGLQRQLQAQQESAGLKEMRAEREEVEGLIVERRKELIHQLLRLLPIVPMSDSETCIINVLLPNNSSLFLTVPQPILATALGYIVHILGLLAHYLNVALPFMMDSGGSRSFIYREGDTTIFPLFMKGGEREFRVAIEALNLNLAYLCFSQGLLLPHKLVPQTLPNIRRLVEKICGWPKDMHHPLLVSATTPTSSSETKPGENEASSEELGDWEII
ncbi:hypothetical protein QOT17_002045 [Balamuthia mandrillaris]